MGSNGDTVSFQIGHEDIGEFVSASFEMIDKGNIDPFCLAAISWTNNIDGTTTEYGAEWFGRGQFLSSEGITKYDEQMEFLESPGDDLIFLPITQSQVTIDVSKKVTSV